MGVLAAFWGSNKIRGGGAVLRPATSPRRSFQKALLRAPRQVHLPAAADRGVAGDGQVGHMWAVSACPRLVTQLVLY